jgi:hypothetical protein
MTVNDVTQRKEKDYRRNGEQCCNQPEAVPSAPTELRGTPQLGSHCLRPHICRTVYVFVKLKDKVASEPERYAMKT